DHERARAVLLGVVRDVADDGQVGGHEVVAALAGLAGDARRDDQDVGAGAVGPARRARDVRVIAEDGAVLLEVERLPLRVVRFLRDVEEDDVAELLPGEEGGELAADISGSNEGDLLTSAHGPASSTAGAGAEDLSPESELAARVGRRDRQ